MATAPAPPRALVNPLRGLAPAAEPDASRAAVRAHHRSLPGYAATPLRSLPGVAAELGLGHVLVKDETARLGLPAFKVLGASWAVQQLLAHEADGTAVLCAATDGNHGRAVARVARWRGLGARVFVPASMDAARRAAIASEGAAVEVVVGT